MSCDILIRFKLSLLKKFIETLLCLNHSQIYLLILHIILILFFFKNQTDRSLSSSLLPLCPTSTFDSKINVKCKPLFWRQFVELFEAIIACHFYSVNWHMFNSVMLFLFFSRLFLASPRSFLHNFAFRLRRLRTLKEKAENKPKERVS